MYSKIYNYLQPSREEGNCPCAHYHPPKAEGKSAIVVQEQEIQAFGLEAKEDQGNPQEVDSLPSWKEDQEGNAQAFHLPTEKICPKIVK